MRKWINELRADNGARWRLGKVTLLTAALFSMKRCCRTMDVMCLPCLDAVYFRGPRRLRADSWKIICNASTLCMNGIRDAMTSSRKGANHCCSSFPPKLHVNAFHGSETDCRGIWRSSNGTTAHLQRTRKNARTRFGRRSNPKKSSPPFLCATTLISNIWTISVYSVQCAHR